MSSFPLTEHKPFTPGFTDDMPVPAANPRLSTPVITGITTDYDQLCAPFVESVRDVLNGKRYRVKVRYLDADFHFYHGCLMTQVNHNGRLLALPPISLDTQTGLPVLHALPDHQADWLNAFFSLPKSLLLFYFSLMKRVFSNQPLSYQWQHLQTGELLHPAMPYVLQQYLSETGWAD